ncbi:efflux RND transporter periplasmic adaptor subunit [Kineobactrum salinum]|uniref:efflux RND transporter periplasmic adaptor subunit n=1 Tax=Kineobactrum salinum TaxID=2708301 RepID=UPI001E5DB619|nr:efflux RND transporter periplasmic adaptor subunit [Kineobactrum salinum]
MSVIRFCRTYRATAILAAVLVALLAVLAGCRTSTTTAEEQPEPPAVEVATVAAAPVTLWQDFTGRIEAVESVELRPRVSGYIDRISFQEGDLVERGEVLFVIDQRPYAARERAARAQLEQAQSQLALARSEAERAQQLLESQSISRELFEQRSAAQASREAELKAARAALDSAQLELEYTEVRAPISGRISRAYVTRGNLASADTTVLTTLVSVDPVHVYFESDSSQLIAGSDAGNDAPALPVRVGLAGETGHPHQGELDFVDNRLNAGTGTIQYRAVLPNPDGILRPGQFARVGVPTDHLARALLVDRRALLTDQDRRYVYLVGADNVVSRQEVVPGREVEDLVVIEQGLATGDRVIVNGVQKVMAPGMAVAPQLVSMDRDARGPVPLLAGLPTQGVVEL